MPRDGHALPIRLGVDRGHVVEALTNNVTGSWGQRIDPESLAGGDLVLVSLRGVKGQRVCLVEELRW